MASKKPHWQAPAEFRIAEQQWKTIPTENMDGDTAGLMDPQRCAVLLSTGINPELIGETWLHEVFHAAWAKAGLGEIPGAAPHEEQIVIALSTYLWAVLRGNKLRFD